MSIKHASELSQKRSDLDERQIVVFRLGNEEFGVNISEVREINRIEHITRIPNTEPYIKGVINLRGGIVVVIDLAVKMGQTRKEADKNTRIIVIEVGNNTLGMVVDSATEVLRLSGENIRPAPALITQKIDSNYIEGVGILGERLLILLDLAKILESRDIRHINEITKAAEKMDAAALAGDKQDKSPENS